MSIAEGGNAMTESRFSVVHVRPDALQETLAAELALAAYRVVLGVRTQGIWLDPELDLWRALADTVETWGREWPRCR